MRVFKSGGCGQVYIPVSLSLLCEFLCMRHSPVFCTASGEKLGGAWE